LDLGIGVAIIFRAIHVLKYFRDNFGFKKGMFPKAERIADSTISLSTSSKLTNEEISFVIDKVQIVDIRSMTV
jgi:dTDP-4-amino-4,6-dideoxygalactose transaminase